MAENDGLDSIEMLSKLYSAHHTESASATEDETVENANKSGACVGIDIEKYDVADVTKLPNPVMDLLITKQWAIKFATDSALTILRVDQVCYIFYKRRLRRYFF